MPTTRVRTFQLCEQADRAFRIRSQDGIPPVCEAESTLKQRDDPQRVLIGGSLCADGRWVSGPALLVALGKTAGIRVGTPDGGSIIDLELTVRRLGEGGAARRGL